MAQDGAEQPEGSSKPGISLSFAAAKVKKRVAVAVNGSAEQKAREAITGFGSGGAVTADGKPVAAGPKVIAKQEDTFQVGGGRRTRELFIPDRDEGPTGQAVEDRFEAAAEEAAPEQFTYGLNVVPRRGRGADGGAADTEDAGPAATAANGHAAAAANGHVAASGREEGRERDGREGAEREGEERGRDWETRAYRQQVDALPDEADAAAYEAMPIEEFGAAMLRGMGWKEGMGVGRRNTGPAQPFQYVQRPHRLGLGAQPALMEDKPKKYIKPGESREQKQHQVYIDAEGRQRHVMTLDDKLVDRQLLGVHPGKTMHLLSGRHEGLSCEVLAVEPKVEGKSDRATVRLAPSGETVTVRCKELGEKYQADELRKSKQRDGRGSDRDGQRKESRKQDGDRGRSSGGDDSGRDAKRRRGVGGDAERDPQSQKQQRRSDESSDHEDEEQPAAPSGPGWLQPHIRVRIVDKTLAKGRLYLKKATIVDVHQPTVCDVVVDEPRQRVTGVRQQQLETIVPKKEGARVLLLHGDHKGHRARLLSRNTKAAAAAVQLTSDYTVVKVSFDDIAEYVGDAHEEE